MNSDDHLDITVGLRVRKGAQAPARSYATDAGLDLFTWKAQDLQPGGAADIHCGVRLALPDGFWGLIMGRSSTYRKRHLTVLPAVIDAGYRGDIYVFVRNEAPTPSRVEAGERVAQLIVLPTIPVVLDPAVWAEMLETERGRDGFGSTGR